MSRRAFESLWSDVGVPPVRLHAHQSVGDDPFCMPVIFVPGLGVSGRSIMPTAELMPYAHAVCVVDLPGHGASSRPSRGLSLSEFAEVLAAWHMSLTVAPSAWVGHSFGCQVLTELAVKHPSCVARLVLVSPTVDPRGGGMVRQLARLLLDATREPADLLRLLARDYHQTGLRTLHEIGRLAISDRIETKLPLVSAPTLVACGDRDPVVPVRWAREACNYLPLGQLCVIPGAAHAVHFTAPAALAHAIARFLNESPARRPARADGSNGAP